ncbi:DUF1634 domain-containing protein [Thermoplasmatales archaeon AK]|nr:DUF1634 domain-containing protein [Thermoplasmatales archaeon AK]
MPQKFDVDTISSYTLRTGVIASILLIIAGTALLFIQGHGGAYSLDQISSYNYSFHINSARINLLALWVGLAQLNGLYFIALGLWVLIFTPITVVVIALLSFIETKNHLYIVMSLLVLFNLFFAMLVIPRFVA